MKSWDYIELTPAMFLSEGPLNVNPKIQLIFKLLRGIKEAVIFFDDLNVFQEMLGERSSSWFISDFLARFAELIKRKNIKLILASNMITPPYEGEVTADQVFGVNTLLIRLQRIDLVLPMGAISWRRRIERLREELVKANETSEEMQSLKQTIDSVLSKGKIVKCDVEGEQLRNFLIRTNYVCNRRLDQILEAIFVKKDKKLYEIFFLDGQEKSNYGEFQEGGFYKFQKLLERETLSEYIRFAPFRKPVEQDVDNPINDNIF